jgi:hypothetical protein
MALLVLSSEGEIAGRQPLIFQEICVGENISWLQVTFTTCLKEMLKSLITLHN